MTDQNSAAVDSSQQNSNQSDPLGALEELLDEAKQKQAQAGAQTTGQNSKQVQAAAKQKEEQQEQQQIQSMKQQKQQEDREKIQQKLKQIQGAKHDMSDEQTAPIVRNKRERIAEKYQIRQLQHTKIEAASEDNQKES